MQPWRAARPYFSRHRLHGCLAPSMDRPSPTQLEDSLESRCSTALARGARRNRSRLLCVLSLLLSALVGCAGPKWVTVRDAPHNPLSERLMLLSRGGPQPTER